MRHKYAALAVAMSLSASAIASPDSSQDSNVVRPFHARIPDVALADLRARIAATRWPDQETVIDRSQGARLVQLQELVRYWGSRYDWCKAEARLNALPQYMTRIDGADIYFTWVAFPQSERIAADHDPRLAGPGARISESHRSAHRSGCSWGTAADAFDVVIPSIPGYEFSGKPMETGWDPDYFARVWGKLIQRLGYTRYVAQGGDWGAPITSAMARQALPGLVGIHLNLPATVPPEAAAALASGGPAPAALTDGEGTTFDALLTFTKQGNSAYVTMLGARPQTIGYGVTDSPAFLAAFMLGHPGFAKWPNRVTGAGSPTVDEVLDDFTLFWLTNSAASAGRLYWENMGRSQPQLYAGELRAAFRKLR